jgi:hypothetical protein
MLQKWLSQQVNFPWGQSSKTGVLRPVTHYRPPRFLRTVFRFGALKMTLSTSKNFLRTVTHSRMILRPVIAVQCPEASHSTFTLPFPEDSPFCSCSKNGFEHIIIFPWGQSLSNRPLMSWDQSSLPSRTLHKICPFASPPSWVNTGFPKFITHLCHRFLYYFIV